LSDGITQNPLFKTHMKPFLDYTTTLNSLGDLYLASQSNVVANCVLNWASAWSNTNLLTEYRADQSGRVNYTTTQGDYERKWLVGEIIFNLAKIKNSKTNLNTTKVNAIKTWLGRSMNPIRLCFDNRIRYNAATNVVARPENLNNHQYWAGLTVMLYGILFNDVSHQNWGKLQYRLGINSILDNGTLATEMARGSQAFAYHQFALQPLVMMAELSIINGDNLYAHNSYRINKLASLVIRSYEDFSSFTSLTQAAQLQTPQSMIRDLPYYLDWMEIWYSRLGNPHLPALIKLARASQSTSNGHLKNYRTGGDMTMAWGVKACHLE
jgi:poly(beta-D-mannuronate) lyase